MAVRESAQWVPGAALRPFVSRCSGFRQEGMAAGRHRGVPSPDLTFIVMLDDPLVIAEHPDPRQPGGSYQSLIGGLHTAPALITRDGRWSGVQLAVTPLGARALLGLPAGELANLDVDAALLAGNLATELRDRLRAESSWAGRFGVIDGVLGRRVARGDGRCRGEMRPEVAQAWRRLRDTRGAAGVSSLAAETGWSTRHLTARFRAEFGLAPKAAARVFRFDAARRRLAHTVTRGTGGGAGAGVRLADLAAEFGYYDQAHLAAEFRALAGCPPSRWLAEEFRFLQATPGGGEQDQEHDSGTATSGVAHP
jgi:AraC-like DNA-binding protein